MFNLLLDHFDINKSRRALLATSFLTLSLPSLILSGEGLEIFGLTIAISINSILVICRLLIIYLLWVYAGLLSIDFIPKISNGVVQHYERKTESLKRQAMHVDDQIDANDPSNPEEQGFSEPDDWWIPVYKSKEEAEKIARWVETFNFWVSLVLKPLVFVAPTMLLAMTALLCPIQANAFFSRVLAVPL